MMQVHFFQLRIQLTFGQLCLSKLEQFFCKVCSAFQGICQVLVKACCRNKWRSSPNDCQPAISPTLSQIQLPFISSSPPPPAAYYLLKSGQIDHQRISPICLPIIQGLVRKKMCQLSFLLPISYLYCKFFLGSESPSKRSYIIGT